MIGWLTDTSWEAEHAMDRVAEVLVPPHSHMRRVVLLVSGLRRRRRGMRYDPTTAYAAIVQERVEALAKALRSSRRPGVLR